MVTTVGAAASATGLDPPTASPPATTRSGRNAASLRRELRIVRLLTARTKQESATHLPGERQRGRGGEVDRRLGRRERLDVVLVGRLLAGECAERIDLVRRAGPHPGQRAVEDDRVRAFAHPPGPPRRRSVERSG